jgi:hypothetical protein
MSGNEGTMSFGQGIVGRRNAARALVAGCLAAAALLCSAATARSAVTIGQTPLSTPPTLCTTAIDLLQPTVTSATKYVVPDTIAQGTVTSWSHRAAAGGGQTLTMKVFRNVGGSTYRVVGHDGPRALNPSSLNTFSTSVAVKAGDVLGVNSANAATVPNACSFTATGDSHLERAGDLPDGASGSFSPVADSRVNASARVEPLNTFSFGSVFRNRRGTALVQVIVPNPGTLSVSGTGVTDFVRGSIRIGAPGTVNVLIGATDRKKRKLRRRGRVFVAPSFRYTPTSGSRKSQTLVVKLRKKRKKR